MRIVPKMIPIVKSSFLSVSHAIGMTLTQRRSLTWWQELKKRFFVATLGPFHGDKGRRVPRVSHNSASRTPLRRLKQTRIFWPFSSWRATAPPQTSTTALTEVQNCPNPSRPQSPPSTKSHKNLKSLKICSKPVTKLTISSQERRKNKYFHYLMRGDALQTFEIISSSKRQNLGEMLTVFRRKYIETRSMARAKHRFQQLFFNRVNQNLFGL